MRTLLVKGTVFTTDTLVILRGIIRMLIAVSGSLIAASVIMIFIKIFILTIAVPDVSTSNMLGLLPLCFLS